MYNYKKTIICIIKKTWKKIYIYIYNDINIYIYIYIFLSRDSHSSPLFKSSHILQLEDKIFIENIVFINKSFNNLLPPNLVHLLLWCSQLSKSHLLLINLLYYEHWTDKKKYFHVYRTDSFRKNMITIGAINS